NGLDGYYPIARPGWVEANGPATLGSRSTEGMLADTSLWPSLHRFHHVILACVAQNARETAEAERERLQKRTATDQRVQQKALAQLAAVVTTGPAEGFGPGDPGEVLLAACQLLGRSLQVPVK